MKFYVYSVYDPEIESFATNLACHPLDPKDMSEQYRRSWVKMEPKDKAFMKGKIAVCLGVFDDEKGKIDQSNFIEVFKFEDIKEEVKEEVKGEDEEKADA